MLQAQLAPYVASGALQLLLRHRTASTDMTNDRVRAIAVRDVDTGDQRVLHAAYFADATELNVLLLLTFAEYPVARTGSWSYRRILDRDQFAPGTLASDVTIVNWGQNDYSAGTLIDVPDEVATARVAHVKAFSLSLLYWLQTDAPRPDGGIGWEGLWLRPDVVGTADGLAVHAYVREADGFAPS